MNKLSILFMFLFCANLSIGQEVSDIVKKVKVRQDQMVDIDLAYEECFKNISTNDSEYYIHSGFLLNRNGNSFYGKLVHEHLGVKKSDTVIEWVEGVNARRLILKDPPIYDEYKTNVSYEPIFYQGINLINIDGFKFETQDAQVFKLSKTGVSKDNLGNDIKFNESIIVRKNDYTITQYESCLSMFGTEQYTCQKLISIKSIDKKQKRELLKNLDTGFTKVGLNGNSEGGLTKNKLNSEKADDQLLLKPGDVFPSVTGFLPGSNDSMGIFDSKDSLFLLDYFFTSCGPCIAAIPHLMTLSEKYKSQGLRIYGIDPIPVDTGRLVKFVKKFGITYPILRTSKDIPLRYHLITYPTLILVNNKREIIKIFIGYKKGRETEIEDEITKAIKR